VTRTNEHGQPIGDPVDWRGAEPPAPRVLEGSSVRLEPLAAGHAEQIMDTLAPHPALWTYRAEEPPTSVKEAAQRLAHGAAETDHVTFAVVPTASGVLEGMASYLRIAPAAGSIEVGSIIYGPSLQRTRAATEAMFLMARHAFEDLGYRRYEWKCDSLNEPSRRAAERLGFSYEGRFRNALVYKGRNRDTDWFSITDGDWPALRRAYEGWLADENFDAEGRQRRPLRDFRR